VRVDGRAGWNEYGCLALGIASCRAVLGAGCVAANAADNVVIGCARGWTSSTLLNRNRARSWTTVCPSQNFAIAGGL